MWEEILILHTEKLLNRPCRIAVSKTSGLAGVAHWLNTYFNLTDAECYDKKHPVVEAIKLWIDKQYDEGRVTSIGDIELEKIALLEIKKYNDENKA